MISPVRVLHVVRPASGGIRQHVLNLLDGLDPAQITSSVAAPHGFLSGLQSRFHWASVRLDIAPRLSPLSDLKLARVLARVQPEFSDVVHAHGVRAAWVAALAHRRRPFPLVFTAHNQIERTLAARLGISFISRRCVKIIAVSQAVAESLVACGAARAKIKVIPNGIDLAHSASSPAIRTNARAAFSVPEAAFVVAAAARFSPEKGLDVLIQAARLRPRVTFLIAGDGPLFAALSRDLPSNVKLLGRLDDVRSLLAAADVFAVPSRREGQGIAALEAAASGLPLVVSRVGGLAEMFSDGETALLVPPGDPESLAAALSRLGSDPQLRQALARNAWSLAQARYDIQTMLDTLTALYGEIGT